MHSEQSHTPNKDRDISIHVSSLKGSPTRFYSHYNPKLQEQSSVAYTDVNILGRSAPIVVYSSTGSRTVTVTLHITAESNAKKEVIDEVAWLQALKYPTYTRVTMLPPPIVLLSFGGFMSIRGVVETVNPTWGDSLTAKNEPLHAEVEVSVKEVVKTPYGADYVRNSFYSYQKA
jgi:hypothetical protein